MERTRKGKKNKKNKRNKTERFTLDQIQQETTQNNREFVCVKANILSRNQVTYYKGSLPNFSSIGSDPLKYGTISKSFFTKKNCQEALKTQKIMYIIQILTFVVQIKKKLIYSTSNAVESSDSKKSI